MGVQLRGLVVGEFYSHPDFPGRELLVYKSDQFDSLLGIVYDEDGEQEDGYLLDEQDARVMVRIA